MKKIALIIIIKNISPIFLYFILINLNTTVSKTINILVKTIEFKKI